MKSYIPFCLPKCVPYMNRALSPCRFRVEPYVRDYFRFSLFRAVDTPEPPSILMFPLFTPIIGILSYKRFVRACIVSQECFFRTAVTLLAAPLFSPPFSWVCSSVSYIDSSTCWHCFTSFHSAYCRQLSFPTGVITSIKTPLMETTFSQASAVSTILVKTHGRHAQHEVFPRFATLAMKNVGQLKCQCGVSLFKPLTCHPIV